MGAPVTVGEALAVGLGVGEGVPVPERAPPATRARLASTKITSCGGR